MSRTSGWKKELMVADHYSLLMERFPKLALLLPHLGSKREKEKLSLSPGSLDLIYFYGLGCGEAYEALSDWLFSDSKKRLVFLEDDLSAMASFLHQPIAKEILENQQVTISLVEDLEEVIEEFPSTHIDCLMLPSKDGFFFKELKERLLRKAFLAWAQHLDRMHGYQMFENFLNNLTILPESFYANRFKGKFQGVPAIVCGAGPSLQPLLPFLKSMENRGLVIGGGSTLAALTSQGVMPHFGIAVDPNREEFRRLKNSFAFEVPFLYSTRLFSQCFQVCNGPFGYMRSGIGGVLELWIEEALGLEGSLIGESLDGEALSVTSICLAWAQFLGCNPIFLTGVDLAYTGNSRYASGIELISSPFSLSAELGVDRRIQKENPHGEIVETAIRWVMESSCFSRFAKTYPDHTFFNLSQKGLGFETIPYLPIEEAEEKFFNREWNLREKVSQEIFQASFPLDTKDLIEKKIEELKKSLDEVIACLVILAGEKKGSCSLAELELRDELAFSLLFYDAEKILVRDLVLQKKEESLWPSFLSLARKYKLVFDHWREE
ncbi:MAG: motility associated factor glycosyltransferase family protein [Chlamydiia bacterium]|nr:motility associated factor glycosyltransferase family protein [Chlamydiia bacterium]